jgi:hypothetical protein
MTAAAFDAVPIVPGYLLAGPHPSQASRTAVVRACEHLLQLGVRVFIDLTLPEETSLLPDYAPLLRQAALEEKVFVRYERLPFAPGATPSPEGLEALIVGLHAEWNAGHAAYVHAVQPDERVVLFAACAARFLKRKEALLLLESLPPIQRRYAEERFG